MSSGCPVCGAPMRGPVAGFRYDCPQCGYARAALSVAIADAPTGAALREDDREAALAPLRRRNFETVLDRLALCAPPPARLLEVGCAHGWFLDAAHRRGYAVQGVEPDRAIGAQAVARGHAVALGFFPDALPDGAKFDVVAFNDVFEHLPDPRAALGAVHGVLREGGVLAINLPSSRGAFYRIAEALRRCGWRAPHDRLWQAGFPSPHLSYFHPEALARLARSAGFSELERQALPSLAREGLWQRLRYDARASWLSCAVTWTGVSVAAPLLRRLPSDITLQLFRREPAGAAPQREAASTGARASAGVTTATR